MIVLKKKGIGIIVFSILIIILYYSFIKYEERIKYLEDRKVLYTTGTITFLEQGKGGPWFNYNFFFDAKEHFSRTTIGELSKEKRQKLKSYIGKKYFVKFSIEKPEYSEIYLDKPIPKDFVYKEGQTWSKIPIDQGGGNGGGNVVMLVMFQTQ